MITFPEAVSAYSRMASQAGAAAGGGQTRDVATDFSAALRQAAEGAVDTLREGEAQSMKAAIGQADINEVVAAVSKAELTLHTVVTVRDKAISAYQEILRMPI